ncbi:SGNH/GDSL hydrolase family protein [Paenibacillus tengchongensis]|uniref:SGNH/GDSL hydrolase family protein n=1 Tax=Paenibacillus tengchongensis TaxID=2608684 RepID=UPI00124DA1C7|nr:SGNH/GDSL hydrolase family protein [Paenibacillus tengchongensis]
MAETMQVFKATGQYVKMIGRTHYYNGALWLALSGSGVEFSFTGKKAVITIKGDQIAEGATNQARIGIEVNGVRVVEEQIMQPVKAYTVFESGTEQQVTVRVLKLSEAAMSTAAIQEIAVDAEEGIQPTPGNVHRIEFIGDSITCGYGVDDEHELHPFATATEDVTKAYAYLTAQALEADYSMVSYSGYGIISGYTDNDQKLTTHLLTDYYEKLAKSEGRLDGTLDPLKVSWDFSRFVPELIVINLGTNDDSYTKDDAARQAEYAEQYAEFLKKVRRNNEGATILCTLGIMGDRLFPWLEQAVDSYTETTGDTNIATMKFDVQLAADGYAADFHPSQATHRKAAQRLAAHIKGLMNWD